MSDLNAFYFYYLFLIQCMRSIRCKIRVLHCRGFPFRFRRMSSLQLNNFTENVSNETYDSYASRVSCYFEQNVQFSQSPERGWLRQGAFLKITFRLSTSQALRIQSADCSISNRQNMFDVLETKKLRLLNLPRRICWWVRVRTIGRQLIIVLI